MLLVKMSLTRNSDFFHVPGTPCVNIGQGWAIAKEKKMEQSKQKQKAEQREN